MGSATIAGSIKVSAEGTTKCVPLGTVTPSESFRGSIATRLKATETSKVSYGRLSAGLEQLVLVRRKLTDARWIEALGFFEKAVHFQ